MSGISQTTFSNPWTYEFRLPFHCSLLQKVQLTVFQHWFLCFFLLGGGRVVVVVVVVMVLYVLLSRPVFLYTIDNVLKGILINIMDNVEERAITTFTKHIAVTGNLITIFWPQHYISNRFAHLDQSFPISICTVHIINQKVTKDHFHHLMTHD